MFLGLFVVVIVVVVSAFVSLCALDKIPMYICTLGNFVAVPLPFLFLFPSNPHVVNAPSASSVVVLTPPGPFETTTRLAPPAPQLTILTVSPLPNPNVTASPPGTKVYELMIMAEASKV
jgi:hypothetical protein